MYNAFWRLALFVRGQSFSVKTFDRSRNGCQVIREGAGNDFRGPSVQALPLPSRVSSRAPVFSCAHHFQAPATQGNESFEWRTDEVRAGSNRVMIAESKLQLISRWLLSRGKYQFYKLLLKDTSSWNIYITMYFLLSQTQCTVIITVWIQDYLLNNTSIVTMMLKHLHFFPVPWLRS